MFVLFLVIKETLSANVGGEFQIFQSQQYGESDLLFKDATKCLIHTSHLDYRTILGEEFYRHADNVFNCTHSGESIIHVIHVVDFNFDSIH